tara:strand:+ start:290 stop:442 length:153 start_codon:yes stop_codon:yes gene_type:complete
MKEEFIQCTIYLHPFYKVVSRDNKAAMYERVFIKGKKCNIIGNYFMFVKD